jgi:3-isopropylmalate dehydrogenase
MTVRVALVPGDGVGPEVVSAAVTVLDAAAAMGDIDMRYESVLAGGAGIEAYGVPLRDEDLALCGQADAILLGAVGGPAWDNLSVETRPERALLRLRAELGLGINLRPVTWTEAGSDRSPVKSEIASGADIAFVRELTGGVYFGRPSYYERAEGNRHAVDTCSYTEEQVRAVAEFAFELARTRRSTVTSVDKANVMNTSRLWREVVSEVGAEYPDVELEHALVDSFSMSLIAEPRRYDVVVTENLFGDVLTDLAAVLAGSLGTLPSASLAPDAGGRRFGMYEPIHGSAPSIAGQNIANPAGAILSVALMLEWSLGAHELASAVRSAVGAVLSSGRVTVDLAAPGREPVRTQEFAGAVVDYLRNEGGARGDRNLRYDVA